MSFHENYLRSHVYLARQLTPSELPRDEDYEIEVSHVSLEGFETMIEDGRLLDARVIAALYLARAFISREGDNGVARSGITY